MIIWIDAQLSPSLALWINQNFIGIEAKSVRSVGLRDASDLEIFKEAKKAGAVVMTKDVDFVNLQRKYGSPPQIILVMSGNTSNAVMREILSKRLEIALISLKDENLVTIEVPI